MNKRGNERLLKLATFLETSVKPKAFDLNVICKINRTDDYGNSTAASDKDVALVLKEISKGNKKYDCGTAACAIGHMPLCFPRTFEYKENNWGGNGYIEVENRNSGEQNFDAAKDFFNIDDTESYYLFQPDCYPHGHKSPKYVAGRIRSFVKNGLTGKKRAEVRIMSGN